LPIIFPFTTNSVLPIVGGVDANIALASLLNNKGFALISIYIFEVNVAALCVASSFVS